MCDVIRVSPLGKTWLLDIDGTVCKHNGYKIDGKDTLLPGVRAFFENLPEGDKVVFLTSRTEDQAGFTEAFLRENGIRFEVDYTDKNMKEKIKTFKNYKDPYILVLGNQEAEEETVSINIRGNKQLHGVPLDKFIGMCREMNAKHSLELIESAE